MIGVPRRRMRIRVLSRKTCVVSDCYPLFAAKKARDKAAAEKDARVANIIDMVTAILDAPISPDALLAQQALDKSQPANS